MDKLDDCECLRVRSIADGGAFSKLLPKGSKAEGKGYRSLDGRSEAAMVTDSPSVQSPELILYCNFSSQPEVGVKVAVMVWLLLCQTPAP